MPHVLVVDDDALIHDVLYDLFLEEGYQVSLASNGTAALALLECERNLVVLLNLTIPGLSGKGVLDALQAAQRDDHRIVVITAGRHPTQERRWVQQGRVRAVVHKPFNIDHLLALVQQVAHEERRTGWVR
jgi:DNA-binding response OmpR family regulator